MGETAEQQDFFMRQALALAELGRIGAPPNPWVGCLLVKEGKVVGQGYHVAPGKPHAESVALGQAGPLARGATAYVTLEPCDHHGHTPPCTEALITAGVRRVVIPLLDPDPRVSGKGVAALEKGGVEVITGVAENLARASLAPYLKHRKSGKPFCILKSAMSIDGRVAARDGTSKWITCEGARADVHKLRAESQAILVGVGTAAVDKPRLTVRGHEVPKQPLRVVFDPKGTFTCDDPEMLVMKTPDLNEVLCELGQRGVLQLLVEGGAATHTAFLEAGLVDRFVLYIGNCLLGTEGKPLLNDSGPTGIDGARRMHLVDIQRFGNSARLSFELHPIGGCS